MRIGRFDIIATIGRGVRGTVYRARHEELGRDVAIKQLNGSVVAGSPAAQRFLREAELLAAIQSDHVAGVYSYEIIDDQPLIEMELLTLGFDRRMKSGPFELPAVLAVLRDVLDGLRSLHGGGVIHGDLKPANILQDAAGHWKLTDGGLSIIERETNPTLLASSVLYIAPETVAQQVRREFRSDLYSVGMLGYEALLGVDGLNSAFPDLAPIAASPGRWLTWLENPSLEAKPLHALRADIPLPVSHFIARLMSKDLEMRYGSSDAALTALEPLIRAPKPAPKPVPVAAKPLAVVARADDYKPQAAVETGPRLIIVHADRVEREVTLTRQTLRIGRDPQNDLVLADQGKAVSRAHAELRWEDGRYVLIDLDSQNGLLVNGKRKPRVALAPDVQVTLGTYTLQFRETTQTAKVVDPEATVFLPNPPAPKPVMPDPVIRKSEPEPVVVSLPDPNPVRPRRSHVWIVAVGVIATIAIVFWGIKARSASNVAAPPKNPDQGVVQDPPAAAPVDVSEQGSGQAPRPVQSDPPLAPAARSGRGDLKAAPVNPSPFASGEPKKKPTAISVLTAPTPLVARRPNETESDWNARDRSVAARYDRARAAMDAGTWTEALTLLADLQRDEPGYQDVSSRFAIAQRRVAAQAMEDGAKQEASGAFRPALQYYQQAQQLEASPAGAEAIRKLKIRMKDEGTKSFHMAEHYQAYGRWSEAAKAFEKAWSDLPDDDPLRKIAKERLDQIKR